jgi:DNA-binding NarL/FixJ family response regulator
MDKNRILFVDDEKLLLEALKRSLKDYRSRWEMTFIDQPLDALEAFTKAPFDVLVSDISMPKMTGLELAKKVKKVSPSAQVIILTGKGSLNTAMAAINDMDIYRYYTKPCHVPDLVKAIEDSLLVNSVDQAELESATASDTNLGKAALNRMPIGVIVTDKEARVVFMNPLAAEIVSSNDGLMVSQGDILLGARPEDSQSLKTLIGEIVEKGGRTSRGIALSRPSMKRPLSVLVSSLEDGHKDGENVILYVTNPEQ